MARAEAHLDRLGIVTRGAVLASGDPGGFASAYRTLSMMEERGRVQRVYAVEGLGASQFALAGVVDQVRAVERELADGRGDHLLLATSDPANPYGAALEWPPSDWAGGSGSPHRPSRGAGCHVVLAGGLPVLYAERGGHTLLTFTHGAAESDAAAQLATAARLLHDSVRSGSDRAADHHAGQRIGGDGTGHVGPRAPGIGDRRVRADPARIPRAALTPSGARIRRGA